MLKHFITGEMLASYCVSRKVSKVYDKGGGSSHHLVLTFTLLQCKFSRHLHCIICINIQNIENVIVHGF